ncbi:MAG TPA: hypothetical protein VKR56_15240 [Candidatus Cybelea sp.]|nr:hypothetical protein [Candidatus Cybelea sp.]
MRISAFIHYAFSSFAAAALLAGCGGLPQSFDSAQGGPARAAMGAPCVYLLSTSEASNLSNSQIVAPNCFIYINDTANMSYSVITAAKILYSGPAPREIGAMFPEATPAPGPTVNDPCPTIAGCSYLMDHPPSISKCGPARQYNNSTVSPGCYKGLTLSGTDTLSPGLYVINGQFHVNNADVSGSGVTIYMAATVQDTNFSSARLTLSAPTGGNYNGMLFYRPPGQDASINFSTCTCDFTGILYFPTTPVNYEDTGGNYQLLIFGQANFSTSEHLHFGPP